MKRFSIFVMIFGCSLSWQAWAATVADSIEIMDPYVRMVPPNAPATAAFMKIKNNDSQDHTLLSAKAYINKITELHTHIHDKGVMRMRQVEKIELPAGEATVLQPGGLHVMLIGLNAPVQKGQNIKLDLTFEDGSTKTVEAVGRPIVPMGKGMRMGAGKMNGMANCPQMGGMGSMQGKQLSNGRNQHPMLRVLHANPATPNLTGIALKNAAELGLSQGQIARLKDWRNQNGDKMQRLFKKLTTLEKSLTQEVLVGISKAEFMAKFEESLTIRTQIAATKLDCRDNMKKVLTAEQFEKLASIYPMM